MKFLTNRWLIGIYGLVLVLTFFKVYNQVFDEKLNLSGDNAAYYILANSISTGQGYRDVHTLNRARHTHFPPGYPTLVAGFSYFTSNDFVKVKQLNGFFFLLSVGLLFLIIKDLTGNIHLSFICCLCCLVNYHLLSYSMIMMSEMSFLLFFHLSIWLMIRLNTTRKDWVYLVLFVLSISFAYHIRSIGISIFLGAMLYFVWTKKYKYFLFSSGAFIILGLPWYLRSKELGSSSYLNQLFLVNPLRPDLGQMGIYNWIERIWVNFERYLIRDIPSAVLNFVPNDGPNLITATEWGIGICLIGVILFGLFRLKSYRKVVLSILIFFFLILLLWPQVWLGTRFLVPLIPLLISLFVYGLYELVTTLIHRLVLPKRQQVLNILLVTVSVLLIPSYASASLNLLELQKNGKYVKGFENYFEIAKWVKDNAPDNAVICCRKKNLFFLESRRPVTSYKFTTDVEEQIEHLKSRRVEYVVFATIGYSSTGKYLYPAIKKYPNKFKQIKHLKDPDTYLLQFRPDLGYWGDWKEGKRHGSGTFVWENGQKYVGSWSDDQQHGAGKILLTNGSQLEGVWTDGILEGEVVLKSKDGSLLERSIYKNNIKEEVLYSKADSSIP